MTIRTSIRQKGMLAKIFALEAMADFQTVAAVAPSSRYLTRAMLDPLPLNLPGVVAELGSGTGAITKALLDLLPKDAVLLAFEINPRFFCYLKNNFSDPRLILINAGAETLSSELRRHGFNQIDGMVSSLGLGFMSEDQRDLLMGDLVSVLKPQSVFTQYQYIHGLQFKNGWLARLDVIELLRQYFQYVERKTIWRNLPPAFVFACHS